MRDDGGITAGRFDTIIAELELQRGLDDDNASAAIDGALAVDERDRENRKAFGTIRTEQRVILDGAAGPGSAHNRHGSVV